MTDTSNNFAQRTRTRREPAFVFDVDRRKIVWANDAAVTLFGEATLVDLVERRFVKTDPMTLALGDIATRLRPGGQVSEAIHFTPVDEPRSAACDIEAVTLGTGRIAIAVIVISLETQNGEGRRGAMLFNAAPIAMIVVASDGSVALANEAASEMGFDAPLADIVASPYVAQGLFEQVITNGGASRTLEATSAFGPLRVRLDCVRVADPAATRALMLVAIHDISDRPVLVLPAIEPPQPVSLEPTPARDQPNGAIGALVDAMPDGAVLLDANGYVIVANARAQKLLGPALAVGGSFIDIAPVEIREDLRDYLAAKRTAAPIGLGRLLEDGRETMLGTKGAAKPVRLTVRLTGHSDGMHVLATLVDLSSVKAAEAQLIEARAAAEDANAQKSDFLARIGHELRTPLNAVIGFAEIMEQGRLGPIGNARYAEYARDIRESGQLLLSLINDLLDLSKAEAGRIELDPDSVELQPVIESCASIIGPQADKFGVALRLNIGRALPPVVADERSLKQILLNLLSNAVKYNRKGGEIEIRAEVLGDGSLAVTVRDDGPGMSEDDLKRALEPYQRAKGASRGREGTGLGLPLARALIEANNAIFSIDTGPGRGTAVRMTFPNALVLAG